MTKPILALLLLLSPAALADDAVPFHVPRAGESPTSRDRVAGWALEHAEGWLEDAAAEAERGDRRVAHYAHEVERLRALWAEADAVRLARADEARAAETELEVARRLASTTSHRRRCDACCPGCGAAARVAEAEVRREAACEALDEAAARAGWLAGQWRRACALLERARVKGARADAKLERAEREVARREAKVRGRR